MNRNDKDFVVQNIRAQYTVKENTELDELRALDAKVKRPANIFAYVFGSIGAVIMGSGMSLVMTDIGTTLGLENAMVPGIIIGIVGLAVACVNYPIYKNILTSRRKKYADEIVSLSDKIMKNEK
ncbi:MAG: dihydropteridine reductase [Clostridia bacterium]|nr:dihydropteridine reductase [Clostridia bacterium]